MVRLQSQDSFKTRRNLWCVIALVILFLLTARLDARVVVEHSEYFSCLPEPWNKAKVMDCTPSYENGAIHLFCHFKLES